MTRPDTITNATRHVFANGLTALVQRNASAPTVSVRGEIEIGAVAEPAAQNGLAVFTGAALIRGAGERSFQQIVAETEELGCSVNAGGGLHGSGFGGKALAEDLPLIITILADMVQHPTFPEQEIERLRGQFLMGLRESEQETGTQASRALRAMLYPAEHPYSRLSSGTVASVQAITRADLLRFQQLYHPALTTIAIVGDVDPPAVLALLEDAFGAWHNPHAPLRVELPPVPPIQGSQRRDIALPGKVQADLIWAVHGLKRSDPEYYAAMLANLILGQLGMGGRLGEQVRETQGMAYYCYSSLDADRGAGPWAAVAGVNPDQIEQALAAIQHEIAHFVQAGPSADEVADAQAYLTGSLVLGLETSDGIAGMLLGIERHGLGLDYIERYPAIINAISTEAIMAAAQRYLSTEQYVVATAGPPRSEQNAMEEA
jgi:zinc protease